jgi:hypothetical protein
MARWQRVLDCANEMLINNYVIVEQSGGVMGLRWPSPSLWLRLRFAVPLKGERGQKVGPERKWSPPEAHAATDSVIIQPSPRLANQGHATTGFGQ